MNTPDQVVNELIYSLVKIDKKTKRKITRKQLDDIDAYINKIRNEHGETVMNKMIIKLFRN